MSFSQRQGITPTQKIFQLKSIDNDLKNSLWSLVQMTYWDTYETPDTLYYIDYIKNSNREKLIVRLWLYHLKIPIDEIPTHFCDCLRQLRKHFFSAEWFQIYDFIEFVAEQGPSDLQNTFIKNANDFLEQENSAYRFVNNKLTEITSEIEIVSIENAIENTGPFSGVKQHLESSLQLLSDRQNPDFRNSIKEAISAVESLCKTLTNDNDATLGKVLGKLERQKGLHPALKSAFSSMYGYTSAADGIRHALMDKDTLTKADAKLMLVSCSAFTNYLIEALSE